MPLAFESLSHGTSDFGIFKIETDLLLLDRYLFLADSFYKKSIPFTRVHFFLDMSRVASLYSYIIAKM
jgi:hypothetical protein